MTRPTREAIETFTSITGASESEALQKLEEYGGNLNEAVNAYFNPGDRHITNPAAVIYPQQHNIPEVDNHMQVGPSRVSQLLSAVRSFKPSSLLDPNYRRRLLNEFSPSAFTSNAPFVSHPGGPMGVPVGFNDGIEQPHHPRLMPSMYDDTRTPSHGLENQGNVSSDDGSHMFVNDIEEEMIQAAIEASKQEDSSSSGLMRSQFDLLEDDELCRALSLSLKTAEQEKAMHEQGVKYRVQQQEGEKTNNSATKPGNSSVQEELEDMSARSPVSYMSKHDLNVHPQLNKDAIPTNEWGGISTKELDEAVMLEAALFGEVPEGSSLRSKYEPHVQSGLDRNACPSSASGSNLSSSSVMAQQLLRKQQLAEREKEKEPAFHMNGDESKSSLDEERSERWLAAKETSLPQEPATDDENAVTLLVRMPDGSRRGRRFLKSDKLLAFFDFIDIGRAVKPGTYRVVRPYPRQAFSTSDGSSSLNELGLTSKQEVLFLEFI